MIEQWYCLDLASLFNAKVSSSTDDYCYCQFGGINRERCSSQSNEYYYDFRTTGMNYLCCDGEQCKLINEENNVLTFLSDGNSYEENVSDYYFKLTKEEAVLAGVYYD